jgi:hypothetical protein
MTSCPWRTVPEWAASEHLDCHTPQVRRADWPDDRRTLERLALAEWPEQAGAQVRLVTVAVDRAEVTLTVNGHYEYWMYYQRDKAVGRKGCPATDPRSAGRIRAPSSGESLRPSRARVMSRSGPLRDRGRPKGQVDLPAHLKA